MRRSTAALAMIALLSACSNDGPKMVSADTYNAFAPGKTNETEVVGTLGQPLHLINQADGTRIAQYPVSEGGTILPEFLVGTSSKISYQTVSFVYNTDGTLQEIRGQAAK